jgi:hypothetical protein
MNDHSLHVSLEVDEYDVSTEESFSRSDRETDTLLLAS